MRRKRTDVLIIQSSAAVENEVEERMRVGLDPVSE